MTPRVYEGKRMALKEGAPSRLPARYDASEPAARFEALAGAVIAQTERDPRTLKLLLEQLEV
jgi:hypothetical protein